MAEQLSSDVKISIIIPTIGNPMTVQYINSEKLKENNIELIIVEDKGWRNASRTRNIGAAVAKGHILCFIDDDACFDFDELLAKIHEASKEIDKAFYWADAPHILIIKREVFLRLGGYDERYPPRGAEAVEIRERLKNAGLELKMLDIKLKHLRDTWNEKHKLTTNKCLTWTYITYKTYPLRKVIFRKNPIELARRIIWLMEWMLIKRWQRRSIFYH
ncbi:MAG: glycosyltransferase family 2 protein [Crenarchaeota archaeon]|nr:glycosyltransferase family 2 protein [Thermoproteota archaeon]